MLPSPIHRRRMHKQKLYVFVGYYESIILVHASFYLATVSYTIKNVAVVSDIAP